MFAGRWFWLVGGLVMVGCSLTPSGLQVGRAALQDAGAVLDGAEDTDGDGVIGVRELAESLVGGGFLLNWMRNRKYKATPATPA